MNWCDPRNTTGLSPKAWRDLSLPINRRRAARPATPPTGFGASRRRAVRLMAGSCDDVRTPVVVASWGWGDADA